MNLTNEFLHDQVFVDLDWARDVDQSYWAGVLDERRRRGDRYATGWVHAVLFCVAVVALVVGLR
ncbi:MAG: hypothetical protein L0Z50_12885 [Verrucomicrobiales bacterium]|nr:hypothetical protein [Verrucomicrobiales bacterium]